MTSLTPKQKPTLPKKYVDITFKTGAGLDIAVKISTLI